MGIAGLHSLLKSIQKPCNVKKFKGQTLGVDAYGWLHRGSVAFALDLALNRQTIGYVDFAMHRVRMLLYYGVTPYLVFDGGRLPSKDSTEETRAARREESKRLGLELYRTGRTSQAQQELQKAVDVTPYMARMLIEELKKLNVQYIVAPYEADAQLVYLEKEGIVNGIISEDSDMLVFGAKVLLSKLDKHGDCIEINRSNFSACRDVSLTGWTDENFRQMCILSGCDYLPNIPKLGLKTAYRKLRRYKTVEKVVKIVQFEGQSRVPPNYLEEFNRAELTFLHQRVFCPRARKLVTLNPLPNSAHEGLTFIGNDIEPDIAIGIACGDLDPITQEVIKINPSYLERARMANMRRGTLPLADEKGQDKPISSFFTPKRIPLGELDPNSLTPSPSQQALLAQNSRRSWSARQAPTPTSVPRAVSASERPPQAPDVNRESFLSRAATLARPLPAKRQRLCSDAAENEPGTSVGERSRFFRGNSITSEKDALKGAKFKKARKAEFGVFSDDSVEDIMCSLPDSVDTVASLTPSQGDDRGTTSTPEPDEKGNPYSVVFRKHTVTHQSLPTPSPECSQSPLVSSAQGNKSNNNGKSASLGLEARFAYVDENRHTRHPDNGRNEELRKPLREGVANGGGAAYSQVSKPGNRARMTPLQRLQQSALGRSKSMNFSKMNMTKDGQAQRGYESDDSTSRPTPLASFEPRGSEDLIVPGTDDSDDGSLSNGDKPQLFMSLDLKKFEFFPS
uniref:Exodeoxyribonuclease 1 n=1 Tax=Coccidioides posadasii RMSCC 3488 TaxID=454284 RepID=A0A0J6IGJ3_COCPO|nr:exodeoxyribonuclease 1 [Coccidioides posadasii RMSCC 3488]